MVLARAFERKVGCSFRVAVYRLVSLRAERRQVFLIHGREAGETFSFLNCRLERGVVGFVACGCAALLVDPDGNADSRVLALPAGGEGIGGEAEVRIVFARDAYRGIVGFGVAEQFVANGFSFLFAE